MNGADAMEVVPPFVGLEAAQGQFAQNQFAQDKSYYATKDILPWWRSREFGAAAIVVAVTATVVGAAIGGGLGSSLSSCQRNLSHCQATPSQSSSPTTPDLHSATSSAAAFETTTGGLVVDYVPELPANVFSLGDNCTELAASTQVTNLTDKFSVYCNVDFSIGSRHDGNGKTIQLADIACITSYSLVDCLEACSDYTMRSQKSGIDNSCGSVTFQLAMSGSPHTNCCLKNSTITHTAGTKNWIRV
ncbi:hypothetical protein F5Y19DRAFT_417423 [Xylariaceae sp. FL1651]|nr:hypothetical protein F5Y19DRAFT_417423 [Xylariaceae sp. FL1651]